MVKNIYVTLAMFIIIPTFILSVFIAFIPALVLRLFKQDKRAEKWLRINGTNIARIIIWSLRIELIPSGMENIPTDTNKICFVSNHQSMLDIPSVLAGLRIWSGFITKKELNKIPILRHWIRAMNCVYIDRKSPRASLGAILQGVENIKNGIPMFVFPEGTRSKDGQLGKFKNGSLKLATKAKATIVPITIDGNHTALSQRKSLKRAKVYLTVAEPIDTSTMDEEQLKGVADQVYSAIEEKFRSSRENSKQ
ncbi:MAG: lysophospholipid acyltransferase family protein [Sphaerochaetaceae bacterium]|jgi:1-acyl-sn-glycerol-3-phosphate acyltransferase